MAARSHAARQSARHQRQPLRANRPENAEGEPQDGEDYVADRLARVRKQLDRVDSMMMKEQDPQKLDRLASAQARMSEQERVLDGRPLPGSRRPGKERPPPRRYIDAIEPTEPVA